MQKVEELRIENLYYITHEGPYLYASLCKNSYALKQHKAWKRKWLN
jgi:hypothetical protein